MPDLAILNQMIAATAKVPLTPGSGKAWVTLIEPQSPGSQVIIKGIPNDAIVIKIDDFTSPDKLFTGAKGECKRADYVIVSNAGGKKRILYIEIKRKKAPMADIIKQLKGAECVMAYCQKIAEVFYGKNKFLSGYESRFVSFGHTSIPKRKTRITQLHGTHNKPEKMMKIDWPNNTHFNHLA